MTKMQIAHARSLVGKMDRRDIAESVGVSLANLKRSMRDTRFVYHYVHVLNPERVKAVLRYYEQHGMPATIKAFPGVSVRSIVERNYGKFKPRQIRWTDEQLIEAARMAGLVSPIAQAKYFNRPRAHVGSIKSLWMKKFGFGEGSLNGMVHWYAKELVQGHKARYLKPLGMSRAGELIEFKRLILWVDLERCLKPEVPAFVRDAICTMANFQRWLHGSKDPRPKILRMIAEREVRSN